MSSTTAPLTRILCVEDDGDIQMIVKMALEAVGGFTVEICGSGEEALLTGPSFKPDLILLDVMMPGMDGVTTMKALRVIPGLKRTPVVFLTAKAMPLEIERFKKLGAADVIAKPFDPMALPDMIRAIWRNQDG